MQLHAQPLRPAPWPRNLQHQPSSYTFPEPLWASLVPEPGHGGEQLDGATLLQEGQVHALGNSARAGGGAQDRAEMPVPGRGGMGAPALWEEGDTRQEALHWQRPGMGARWG